MYDPQLRRFLTPDKAKQQFGAYTYVDNDPIDFVDPDGNTKIYPLTNAVYGNIEGGAKMMKERLNIVDNLLKKIREKIPHQGNMTSGIIDSKGESYLKQLFYNLMLSLIDGNNGESILNNEPHLGAALSEEIGVAACDGFMNVSYSALVDEFMFQSNGGSNIWNNYRISRVQSNIGHSFVVLEYADPVTGVIDFARSIVVDPWVIKPQAILLEHAEFKIDERLKNPLYYSDKKSILTQYNARTLARKYIDHIKYFMKKKPISDIMNAGGKDNRIAIFLQTKNTISDVYLANKYIKYEKLNYKVPYDKPDQIQKYKEAYEDETILQKATKTRLTNIVKKAKQYPVSTRLHIWNVTYAQSEFDDINYEYKKTNKQMHQLSGQCLQKK